MKDLGWHRAPLELHGVRSRYADDTFGEITELGASFGMFGEVVVAREPDRFCQPETCGTVSACQVRTASNHKGFGGREGLRFRQGKGPACQGPQPLAAGPDSRSEAPRSAHRRGCDCECTLHGPESYPPKIRHPGLKILKTHR